MSRYLTEDCSPLENLIGTYNDILIRLYINTIICIIYISIYQFLMTADASLLQFETDGFKYKIVFKLNIYHLNREYKRSRRRGYHKSLPGSKFVLLIKLTYFK